MFNLVEVENLTKSYGDKEALRGLSFIIEEGNIVVLLGPNGAGKTTCLRILATTLLPTDGNVHVLGYDIVSEAAHIRKQIAVVPQEALTDPNLTAWESVYGYLLARGVTRRAAAESTEKHLRQLGLWDLRNRITATYSGGMKRRTLIAMALAANAKLIFLDEPTTGLDPIAKREVWAILHQLRGRATLILSTHLMDEVEALADQVIIVSEGQVLAQGTVSELRFRAPGDEKVLLPKTIPIPELSCYGYIQEDGGRWALFPINKAATHEVMDIARTHGASFSIQTATFEDAYLMILGQFAEAKQTQKCHGVSA